MRDDRLVDARTPSATGAFAAVTALFFAWGLITSLVDPLVAAVKSIFALTNVEAQLSTFAFFIAYGLVSLPAAVMVARLRAVRAVLVALAVMVAGCLVIIGASRRGAYDGVLVGLFALASGITMLQVAANPLAAELGSPERCHLRLTLAQAFNSLGTVLGPLLGAGLLLRGLEPVRAGVALDEAVRHAALGSIDTSFLLIAGAIGLLALFIRAQRGRIEAAVPVHATPAGLGALIAEAASSRWALVGGLAIFLYVGAEVSIGTQMALFLHAPAIWDIPLRHAGFYVSLYWGGAMLGRFAGSALLELVPAPRLLAVATIAAAALCVTVLSLGGVAAGFAALAIGVFNSIMFPVIFTLTLERSTAGEEATSGLLCTAIVGGAFLPLLAGAIADRHGYTAAFVVPLAAYLALTGFALVAGRTAPAPREGVVRGGAH